MATMKDVAHLAGVSTATVSRALTCPEKVSAITHKKIEHAVATAGYCAIPAARLLRRPTSKNIFVLVGDLCDPFYTQIIRGIEETASQHGYTALISSAAKKLDHDSLQQLLLQKQFDGVLLLGISLPQESLQTDPKTVAPLVMVGEYAPELGLPTVHIDDLTAAFNAVSYLTHLGHKHIAQIISKAPSAVTQFRVQGYQQALRRAGIPISAHYNVTAQDSFADGARAMAQLLAQRVPPTAVFCHSDALAIGAMQQAKQLGFCVPRDISIIGFDNIEFAKMCDPELTTISQPRYEMGRQAMLLLLDSLSGKNVNPGSRLLDTQMVIRQSVGAPLPKL
ncbi:MAG: DNA-binding transcriptional regulator CytR [Enterovibrio sp.]